MDRLNIAHLTLNLIASCMLAAVFYSPIHVAGSFVVPHTELTISYGVDPSAVSKFVINASQLRKVGG